MEKVRRQAHPLRHQFPDTSFCTACDFISPVASVWSDFVASMLWSITVFNAERSLSSRSNFKLNRDAALLEWRGCFVGKPVAILVNGGWFLLGCQHRPLGYSGQGGVFYNLLDLLVKTPMLRVCPARQTYHRLRRLQNIPIWVFGFLMGCGFLRGCGCLRGPKSDPFRRSSNICRIANAMGPPPEMH